MPAAMDGVTECADYLSIDTKRGTYSVRMTADAGIDVPHEYGADRPSTERVRVSAAPSPALRCRGSTRCGARSRPGTKTGRFL